MARFISASFQFLSVLGIPIRMHWSVPLGLIVCIIIVRIDSEEKSSADIAVDIGLWIALFAAIAGVVLMHELAHALAAGFWGIRTGGIYLYIFGGLALINDSRILTLTPRQKIVVFASGPLANLLFCIVVLLLAGVTSEPTLADLLELLAGINFGIGIFNLLPIWPLDGGQILRAFMAMSRLNPGLSEGITLAVSLMLGIPFAYLAWKVDAYWTFSLLLALCVLASLRLCVHSIFIERPDVPKEPFAVQRRTDCSESRHIGKYRCFF